MPLWKEQLFLFKSELFFIFSKFFFAVAFLPYVMHGILLSCVMLTVQLCLKFSLPFVI